MTEVDLSESELVPAAVTQSDWLGLRWSKWIALSRIPDRTLPTLPGVYRVHHPEYTGLAYIVETAQRTGLQGRLRQLANNVYHDRSTLALDHDAGTTPHTAVPSLVRLCAEVDTPTLEVSYATPTIAQRGLHLRRGFEAALIALHRRATGHSPLAFERRPLHDQIDSPMHAPSLAWENWTHPQAANWMGLQWTSTHQIGRVQELDLPEHGVYRIWRDEQSSQIQGPLRYIGEGNIPSRLRTHGNVDGPDARFSAAPLPAGCDSTQEKHRRDIEIELIGAHQLACGEPPHRQFGENASTNDSIQTKLFSTDDENEVR